MSRWRPAGTGNEIAGLEEPVSVRVPMQCRDLYLAWGTGPLFFSTGSARTVSAYRGSQNRMRLEKVRACAQLDAVIHFDLLVECRF